MHLKNKMARLNRLPSGTDRAIIRNREQRRAASIAFEALAEQLNGAADKRSIPARQVALASAAAKFAAQQIAVETARQAAKDAENMRAYKQALNFTYQAKALCGKLPPLMSKALGHAVDQDVARLETQLGRPARI